MNTKTPFVLLVISLIFNLTIKSQSDTLKVQLPHVSVSGFIDVFYAYDFNLPETNYRQPFFYNYNRHNEFNLNFGLMKVNVKHPKYRGNFSIQAGTYPEDNYAKESPIMQHIFEANAGFPLNSKKSLWLDAGVFSSHIGFESAISIDNWTLTRSILAENSPYYVTGALLIYSPNERWEMVGLLLNGWQSIKKIPGNSLLSIGTQVKHTIGEKLIFNLSTFIGTNDPDTARRMRYFNNLYAQISINQKLGFIVGFDIGVQQTEKFSSQYNFWYSPVLITQYKITDNWVMAVRGEYYADEKGVIIATVSPEQFKCSGLSLNLDYYFFKKSAYRIEARYMKSENKIFERQSKFVTDNFFLVNSIAISF